MSRSVGRRIGAIVGLALAVFGIGGLYLVLNQTFRTQETITKRLLSTLAQAVGTSFKSFDTRTGQHPVGDISADLAQFPEIEVLDVFDRHGRIRWSSDVRRRGKMAEAELISALTSTPTALAPHRRAQDEMQVVVPLRKTSSCLPCHDKSPDPIGGLAVTASNRKLLSGVVDFTERAGITVVISLILLTVLLLYLIDRVVVSRIRALVGVMTKAEEGDFLVRANVSSHDEIGLLASTFNKMLAKITDLRVERIESEREMTQVMDELSLKAELAKKSELLEGANARLEARLKQLSFLNQLARDLASRLDLDFLIDLLSSRLSEAFGVPALAVLLFERSSNQLRVIKVRGLADELEVLGKPFDPAVQPGGGAVLAKQPRYTADLGGGRGSLFAVPLLYQDSVIGLLRFTSPDLDGFSEEDRDLFVTVASQAALALANAQLFQETLELSLKDGLTGILNRRALESRLELEWSRALRDEAPLSIVMVDIDHFKVYNDQHGHQLGDETLRRVARIIERNIRKVDAVARYGGEEFAIILPRAGKKEAIEVAKKLRRSVEQADFVRGYLQPLGRVTISCGVSTAPEDAATVEDLIKRADESLFAAKEGGRNTVRAWGEAVVESNASEAAGG